MLSALRAGVSACAARIRCRGSTTCFQQKAASAPRQCWPHSYTASTAAPNCPAGFPSSAIRQAWPLNQQLRAVSSGAASASLYQLPEFTFEECAQEVLLCAAPSTTEEQRSAAISRLAAKRELMGESWWMLVECGVWAQDAPPPAGQAGTPARAVLCFSPAERRSPRDFDAQAFALDSNGLPTGEMYQDYRGKPSVSAFEQRTDKKPSKKYRRSCVILRNGKQAMATQFAILRVEHFLIEYFGEHSVHRTHKRKAAAGAAADSAAAGSTSGGAASTDASGACPTCGSSSSSSSRRRRRQ